MLLCKQWQINGNIHYSLRHQELPPDDNFLLRRNYVRRFGRRDKFKIIFVRFKSDASAC